ARAGHRRRRQPRTRGGAGSGGGRSRAGAVRLPPAGDRARLRRGRRAGHRRAGEGDGRRGRGGARRGAARHPPAGLVGRGLLVDQRHRHLQRLRGGARRRHHAGGPGLVDGGLRRPRGRRRPVAGRHRADPAAAHEPLRADQGAVRGHRPLRRHRRRHSHRGAAAGDVRPRDLRALRLPAAVRRGRRPRRRARGRPGAAAPTRARLRRLRHHGRQRADGRRPARPGQRPGGRAGAALARCDRPAAGPWPGGPRPGLGASPLPGRARPVRAGLLADVRLRRLPRRPATRRPEPLPVRLAAVVGRRPARPPL
ncbi:MAG: UDP-glucose 4-epimerase, partial [uncultured Frankineae bacterium]